MQKKIHKNDRETENRGRGKKEGKKSCMEGGGSKKAMQKNAGKI